MSPNAGAVVLGVGGVVCTSLTLLYLRRIERQCAQLRSEIADVSKKIDLRPMIFTGPTTSLTETESIVREEPTFVSTGAVSSNDVQSPKQECSSPPMKPVPISLPTDNVVGLDHPIGASLVAPPMVLIPAAVAENAIADALQHIGGYSILPASLRAEVAKSAEVAHYPAGEVITRVGDCEDKMFVVAKGSVVQQFPDQFTQVLDKGKAFGDTTMSYARVNEATCRANTDLDVFVLKRATIADIVERFPQLGDALQLEGYATMLADNYSPSRRTSAHVHTEIATMAETKLRKILDRNNRVTEEGSWKKGKQIGKGSFASVYRAVDMSNGNHFAVKVVKMRGLSHEAMLNLRTEAIRLSTLRHPNVVRGYGIQMNRTKGEVYIMMELLPLGSLRQLVDEVGPLSEHVVRVYTKQILHGLHYLHSNHILHRDIKPGNLLRSADGTVKLADFGLCRDNLFVDTQTIQGSPAYLSPETVKGQYSIGSDIWALGCTMVELLTGKHLWSDKKFEGVTQMLFHIGNLSELPALPNDITPELQQLLATMLDTDPRNRLTTEQLLEHPWFNVGLPVVALPSNETRSTNTSSGCGDGDAIEVESWSDDSPQRQLAIEDACETPQKSTDTATF